jgi:hypothetical protein
MKSITLFGKQIARRDAIFAALSLSALVLVALAPHIAMAQLPDFGAVTSNIKTKIKPVVIFVRYGVALAAVMVGFFEAFKASKGGQAKGWMNAVLLFIVAGIAIAPETFFTMLGMDSISTGLASWGL